MTVLNHSNRIFYLVLTLVCIIACKKDHNDANTFSCKIDGVVFKTQSKGGPYYNTNVLYVVNMGDNNLFILAGINQLTDQSIYIQLEYLTRTGAFQLGQPPLTGTYKLGNTNPLTYTTDSVNTGEIVITKCDSINKAYSGTFSFNCKNPNTGKIVVITDGRFDVKE